MYVCVYYNKCYRLSSGELNGEDKEEDVEYLLNRYRLSAFLTNFSFSLCSPFATTLLLPLFRALYACLDCPMTMSHRNMMTDWTRALGLHHLLAHFLVNRLINKGELSWLFMGSSKKVAFLDPPFAKVQIQGPKQTETF